MTSYILQNPSLEQTALIRIAITLWNAKDIRALTEKFDFSLLLDEMRDKWQTIEEKVKKKVPLLPQPAPLQAKVLQLIKPIGLQVLRWMEYHVENYYLGIPLPNNLCWTRFGTVDKKKTAEVLIKDESIHIAVRYKLACIYCLKDHILELWDKMPENCQKSFYNGGNPMDVKHQDLVVFWTYMIVDEVVKLEDMAEKITGRRHSLYQYAFERSATSGNETATEYFLQKLTHQERGTLLVKAARNAAIRRCEYTNLHIDFPREYYSDVLRFLISQGTEEQQKKIFRKCNYEVLICLMDFPYQDFFMQTACHMWGSICKYGYFVLLSAIIDKVRHSYEYCSYQKHFRELWQQTPMSYKKYIMEDGVSSGLLLTKLFEAEDEENIKHILKDANVKEKEEIISCYFEVFLCETSDNDMWDLLTLVIQECVSSVNIVEFKMKCITKFLHVKLNYEAKKKLGRFIELIDDIHRVNGSSMVKEDEFLMEV